MTDLDQWRARRGWSYRILALRLRCSRQHAAAICRGMARPGPALADRIAALTEDAVPVETWGYAREDGQEEDHAG